MGFFFSKPVGPTPPAQTAPTKAPKPAIRNSERDQIEYDQRLEEERAKAKSKLVEEYLKQEKAKYDSEHKEPRILILGSSDSGKSTFLKQLKILHGSGFTPEELERAKKNIIYSLFAICRKMIADSPKDTAQFFSNVLTLSMDDAKVGMPDDITATMVSMWKDPAIKDLYQTYGDLFPQTSA
ncbi:hypothetical protein HDV02_005550 [Globomyces sp. JEL0801]|nr:hypothetical protein HDV02_005550 [Globomyces sp. JEL0801]